MGTQQLKLECTLNLAFLKNIFPQLLSFQVTAHHDKFPPFKIFFTSVSKITAPHWNLNVDFNVIYSIFHSVYYTKKYIIINIHYPAPCTRLSTKQLVLGDSILGYLEETFGFLVSDNNNIPQAAYWNGLWKWLSNGWTGLRFNSW